MSLPKVYYGLHMVEGVAEYSEPDKNNGEPYRILLEEDVLKRMDPTYEGLPIYINHVDEVEVDTMKDKAVGYVVNSFFNKPDGKHWVKFIIVSEEGHTAITQGWRLSNAYIIKELDGGGKWHNVDYAHKVLNAQYEHLAIVQDPRYDESIILTPEEFKTYNSDKELELSKLANSKGDSTMSGILKFFKKTKVENSAELEATSITLKNGKELTVLQVVNELESMIEEKKNAEVEEEKKNEEEKSMPVMANGEHMVKVGEEEMSVNALVEKHLNMLEEKKKVLDSEGEEKKEENADSDEEALKKAKDIQEHEEKEIKEKKSNSNFEKLSNAHLSFKESDVTLSLDQVALGKARYGSSK